MAVSLERRVRDVARARPGDRRDLELALSYVESDASSALTKIRIVLERTVVELYTREMGEPPKKPLLGDMLANTQFSKRIERRILSRMHAVRDMANLGAHGEAVLGHDAERDRKSTRLN